MIKKAYIRHKSTYPPDISTFSAMNGFEKRGVTTDKFYGFGDIHNLRDLGHEVMVIGYIGDVWKALETLGIEQPISLDYPTELQRYLGREISTAYLGDIRHRNTAGIFIKPKVQKLFTGFVFQGTYDDRIRLAPYDAEEEVFLSPIVEFLSEYRVYVLRGEIIGVKHYKGDWSISLNKNTVNQAVDDWKSAPISCTLDFGITASGRTLLVEVNDGYAIGNYGLQDVLYSRLLEARWQELVVENTTSNIVT